MSSRSVAAAIVGLVVSVTACVGSNGHPRPPDVPIALHLASPLSRWDQTIGTDGGDLVFSGRTYWPTEFGASGTRIRVEATEGTPRLVLARFDPRGEVRWVRSIAIAAVSERFGSTSVVLSDGSVAWMLPLRGPSALPGGEVPASDGPMLAVLRYDAHGEFLGRILLDGAKRGFLTAVPGGGFAIGGVLATGGRVLEPASPCADCAGPFFARVSPTGEITGWLQARHGTSGQALVPGGFVAKPTGGFWLTFVDGAGHFLTRTGTYPIDARDEMQLFALDDALQPGPAHPVLRSSNWPVGALLLPTSDGGLFMDVFVGAAIDVDTAEGSFSYTGPMAHCQAGIAGRALLRITREGTVAWARAVERNGVRFDEHTAFVVDGDGAGLREVGQLEGRRIYDARWTGDGEAEPPVFHVDSSGGTFEPFAVTRTPAGALLVSALAGGKNPIVGGLGPCDREYRTEPVQLAPADEGREQVVEPGLVVIRIP